MHAHSQRFRPLTQLHAESDYRAAAAGRVVDGTLHDGATKHFFQAQRLRASWIWSHGSDLGGPRLYSTGTGGPPASGNSTTSALPVIPRWNERTASERTILTPSRVSSTPRSTVLWSNRPSAVS